MKINRSLGYLGVFKYVPIARYCVTVHSVNALCRKDVLAHRYGHPSEDPNI